MIRQSGIALKAEGHQSWNRRVVEEGLPGLPSLSVSKYRSRFAGVIDVQGFPGMFSNRPSSLIFDRGVERSRTDNSAWQRRWKSCCIWFVCKKSPVTLFDLLFVYQVDEITLGKLRSHVLRVSELRYICLNGDSFQLCCFERP